MNLEWKTTCYQGLAAEKRKADGTAKGKSGKNQKGNDKNKQNQEALNHVKSEAFSEQDELNETQLDEEAVGDDEIEEADPEEDWPEEEEEDEEGWVNTERAQLFP